MSVLNIIVASAVRMLTVLDPLEQPYQPGVRPARSLLSQGPLNDQIFSALGALVVCRCTTVNAWQPALMGSTPIQAHLPRVEVSATRLVSRRWIGVLD